MLKRALVWILGALALLFVLATVSCTAPVVLRFTDEDGAPASDAYVQYHYEGELINLVHPVSYVHRGSAIVRADGDGRVTIPARLHIRNPLRLSGPPHVWIGFVVVPRLHNAFGPIAERTTSRSWVFQLDEGHRNVVVFDVSRDPERWELSLSYLFDCIRQTLSRGGSRAPAVPGDTRTIERGRELIDLLEREYAAFLAKYGNTQRARPVAGPGVTEAERQQWQAQLDAQLAREPTWGPFVERKWRYNWKEIEMIEESLK
jgi:hypothetical protein